MARQANGHRRVEERHEAEIGRLIRLKDAEIRRLVRQLGRANRRADEREGGQ